MDDVELRQISRNALAAFTAEGADPSDPLVVARALDAAVRQLRSEAVKLVGARGFHALAVRALQLGVPGAPWLHGVLAGTEDAEGLIGLEAAVNGVDASRVLEVAAAFLLALLELFRAFLGRDLTIRLVHRAWTAGVSRRDDDVDPEETAE